MVGGVAAPTRTSDLSPCRFLPKVTRVLLDGTFSGRLLDLSVGDFRLKNHGRLDGLSRDPSDTIQLFLGFRGCLMRYLMATELIVGRLTMGIGDVLEVYCCLLVQILGQALQVVLGDINIPRTLLRKERHHSFELVEELRMSLGDELAIDGRLMRQLVNLLDGADDGGRTQLLEPT